VGVRSTFFDPNATVGSIEKLTRGAARLNRVFRKNRVSALESGRKNILIFCDRLLEGGLVPDEQSANKWHFDV
jgi:hypothetical protein